MGKRLVYLIYFLFLDLHVVVTNRVAYRVRTTSQQRKKAQLPLDGIQVQYTDVGCSTAALSVVDLKHRRNKATRILFTPKEKVWNPRTKWDSTVIWVSSPSQCVICSTPICHLLDKSISSTPTLASLVDWNDTGISLECCRLYYCAKFLN